MTTGGVLYAEKKHEFTIFLTRIIRKMIQYSQLAQLTEQNPYAIVQLMISLIKICSQLALKLRFVKYISSYSKSHWSFQAGYHMQLLQLAAFYLIYVCTLNIRKVGKTNTHTVMQLMIRPESQLQNFTFGFFKTMSQSVLTL